MDNTEDFKNTYGMTKDKLCKDGVTNSGYCFCFLDDHDPVVWTNTKDSPCDIWYLSDIKPTLELIPNGNMLAYTTVNE